MDKGWGGAGANLQACLSSISLGRPSFRSSAAGPFSGSGCTPFGRVTFLLLRCRASPTLHLLRFPMRLPFLASGPPECAEADTGAPKVPRCPCSALSIRPRNRWTAYASVLLRLPALGIKGCSLHQFAYYQAAFQCSLAKPSPCAGLHSHMGKLPIRPLAFSPMLWGIAAGPVSIARDRLPCTSISSSVVPIILGISAFLSPLCGDPGLGVCWWWG